MSSYNPSTSFVEGHVDRVRGGFVEGWIWDPHKPNDPIVVALLSGEGDVLAIALADEFRGDLVQAGKGNGAHGFQIEAPDGVDIGELHVFAIEYNYEMTSPALPTELSSTDRNKGFYDRVSDALGRVNNLSAYLSELEHKCYNKRLRIAQHARELKERFGTFIGTGGQVPATDSLIDIFVFPPIDWSYRVQRPQRLASGLAALGCRVWYISPQMLPPAPKRVGYVVYDEPSPGVFLVKIRSDYPHGAINCTPLSGAVVACAQKAIHELCAEMGIESPCYLVGGAGWQPLLDACPGGLRIYDLMDWVAGFTATTQLLLACEKELARSAHLVVCSSAGLEAYAREELGCCSTMLLRNATHTEMFTVPPPEGNVVVGYVGAIEYWFNRNLMIEVANALPEVTFVLVGHLSLMHESLRDVPNIVCEGECRPERVAEYVRRFDIGIIPFIDDGLTRHTDPVKVYEYLAAGRPVVATVLPELRRFRSGVTMASTSAEFVAAIRKELQKSRNRDAMVARRHVVQHDTWAARAATLHAVILQRWSELAWDAGASSPGAIPTSAQSAGDDRTRLPQPGRVERS